MFGSPRLKILFSRCRYDGRSFGRRRYDGVQYDVALVV